MADIKGIRTKNGVQKIDYDALANKPTNLATKEDLVTKADLIDGKVPSHQLPESNLDVSGALELHNEDVNAHSTLLATKADLVGGKVKSDQLPDISIPEISKVTSSTDGLMLATDKAKLDTYPAKMIIKSNNEVTDINSYPVVPGAILMVYEA